MELLGISGYSDILSIDVSSSVWVEMSREWQGGCLARDRRGGVARFGEELEGVVAPATPRGHLTPCVGSAGVRGRWGTPTLSLPTPRNASLLH